MQRFCLPRRLSVALLLYCLLSMQFAAATCMQAAKTIAGGAAAIGADASQVPDHGADRFAVDRGETTASAPTGVHCPEEALPCAGQVKAATAPNQQRDWPDHGMPAAAPGHVVVPTLPDPPRRARLPSRPFEALPAAPPLRIRLCTYRI